MFRFVVRNLRWLARVPGLPQLFDASLVAWTALVNRPCLAAMDAFEAAALRLPGIAPRVHRLGGVEFVAAGRELGHLHGNGLLDVCVGRTLAAQLVQEGRAEWHHVFGRSAWVSFWIRDSRDIEPATKLLRYALARTPAFAGKTEATSAI